MYLYCESNGILLTSVVVTGARLAFAASTFSAPSVGPGDAPQAALVLNQLAVVTEVNSAQVLLQHGARLDLHWLIAAFG